MLTPFSSALSDTLEVRSYLNRINAKNPLVDVVLEAFEKFLARLSMGRFTLRQKSVLEEGERQESARRTLAAVSGVSDADVTITSTSLDALINSPPEAQSLIYTIAEVGSVVRVLDSVPIHSSRRELLPRIVHLYQGERRDVGLERRVRSALNTAGLRDVLIKTRFGGFTKIFEKSVVAFFTTTLAHARANDTPLVERLLPLAKLFYTNMPIGALPKTQDDDPIRWTVFTE